MSVDILPSHAAPLRKSKLTIMTEDFRDKERAAQLVEILAEMYVEAARSPVTFGMAYPQNVTLLVRLIDGVSERPHALELALGDTDGPNALHYAAGCGCMEVCARLLTQCPRLVFQTDEKFRTPLLWSVHRGLVATSELLLQHGADVNHVDAKGRNALYVAASKGFEKLCTMILSLAAPQQNINHRGPGGRTSLHAAAEVGSLVICERLIGVRADACAATAAHQTPLHLAAMNGHSEVAQYLVKVEGEKAVLMEDNSGCRALDYAKQNEMYDVVAILQKPDMERQRLLRKWQDAFSLPERLLLHPEMQGRGQELPSIGPPQILRIQETELRIVAHVRDLDRRIADYVLEVRLSRPGASTRGKLYYSRTDQQRPIDDVDFDVPRLRENGVAIWEPGQPYQFRVIGHGQLDPRPESSIRSVSSNWSPVTILNPEKRLRPRSSPSGARRKGYQRAD